MAIIRRKLASGNIRFAVMYREGGRQREKRFERKADAVAWDDERRRRARLGQRAADDRLTVAQLLDEWHAAAQHRLAARTLETYGVQIEKRLRPTIGGYRAAQLDTTAIDAVLADIARTAGPATVNYARATLNAAYADAVRRGVLHHNPVAATRKARAVSRTAQPFTVEELMRLATTAGEITHRDWCAIIVGGFAGPRLSELFALRWEDVRDDHIIIRGALDLDRTIKAPKTNRWREVPLLDVARDALAEWREQAPDVDLVFPNHRGGPIHTNNWRRRTWLPASIAAGLEGRKPGDLRHTFASISFAAGASVLWVQRGLGHTTPTVTLNTYSHLIARYDVEMRDRVNAAVARQL